MADSEFNPAVFVWARESAGLSLGDAAIALGIHERSLSEVESGSKEPSRALLARMAKLYRRSLLALYLPTPPSQGDRGRDFRTVPDGRAVRADVEIDTLIRDIRSRQSVVRSILEDEDDANPLDFVGSADARDGVGAVKASIAKRIGFDLGRFRRQPNALDAFANVRAGVESAGAFVLLAGDLGSHHSAIPVEAFRGLALSDLIAPFVVVNDQDAKAAWSFTLLHEVAHLWLGETGVSAGVPSRGIERFCNEVAAEMLLPRADVASVDLAGLGQSARIEAIVEMAARWRLSRPMVAYRLRRAGRLDLASWIAIDAELGEMGRAERAKSKQRAPGQTGGPSYYTVRRHRLGPALLDFARRSLTAGTLSPAKAAQVLGVNARSVHPLLDPAPR